MLYSFSGCLPFYPILPTVYTDALSYYEEIRLLQEEINQIIQQMDDYGASVLQEANNYTNQQINQLDTKLQAIIKNYSELYADDIEQLRQETIKLSLSISQLYTNFANWTGMQDAKFELFKQEVYEYIQKIMGTAGSPYVVNPTNGKIEPLQKTLNDMYKALSWGALTAQEYDNLLITAGQYDHLNITAYNYDHWARFRLFKLIYLRMRNPFDGKMDYYDNVIWELAQLHKNAYTAKGYDDLGLSADGYDAMKITAYEYDWEGKNHLGG